MNCTPENGSLDLAVDWVNDYLGKPWSPLGYGPDDYCCWGLVQQVYKNQRSIDLPQYPTIAPNQHLEINREFTKGSKNGNWTAQKNPLHWDLLLMSAGQYPSHIGIYLAIDGGLILHSTEAGGVVATPPQNLRSQFSINRLGYYRYND